MTNMVILYVPIYRRLGRWTIGAFCSTFCKICGIVMIPMKAASFCHDCYFKRRFGESAECIPGSLSTRRSNDRPI